jgi:hypothetical protein
MLENNCHSTNKKIIALMILLFFAALSMFVFSGCTATKLNRSTNKKKVALDSQTAQTENKKTSIFDRSTITEEDYSLKLIPIDPSKEMGHTTNPKTGEQNYRNAIPVYEKKTKKTNKDLTTDSEEAKTNETNDQIKATTDESAKNKTKLSVPWYAFLFLGFFGFATIVGLFFVWKLTKSISVFAGSLKTLESRLNILEK